MLRYIFHYTYIAWQVCKRQVFVQMMQMFPKVFLAPSSGTFLLCLPENICTHGVHVFNMTGLLSQLSGIGCRHGYGHNSKGLAEAGQ